ncbi:MAG: rod shape-determining protein MreC [Candidatus Yanofskybacteria bacterium]|nr:rod shape-determining protein MreC [Candidatus Yanofskybacteria bacterium]
MRHFPLKSASAILIVLLGFVAFNKFIFRGSIENAFAKIIRNPISRLSERIYPVRSLSSRIREFRQLAEKNQELERQNQQWLWTLARVEDLENENEFLMKSLEVAGDFDERVIPASIFLMSRLPNGYEVLLNKGTDDGLAAGDVVVTPERVLVGQVKEAFPSYAKIRIVGDPGFEATARVLGSQTAGIIKGRSEQGLIFDLIVQGDEIKEGDTVVTSGSDLFPASLVVGKVDYVQIQESTLFKNVRVQPLMRQLDLTRVVVILRK